MRDLSIHESIRQQLTNLDDEQARELARIVERLVVAFQPERIYVFGSQARGDARPDSDVDLMVVVPHSDQPGYRRDQQAYRAISELRQHPLSLEILVVTRDEFDSRSNNPASLPSTVLREGKALYAA